MECEDFASSLAEKKPRVEGRTRSGQAGVELLKGTKWYLGRHLGSRPHCEEKIARRAVSWFGRFG